ncbi:hypothetical protein KO11_01475 [Escherichia coli KO11FL]|nr:hypothetical protein Mu_54 [Escherichia phage Mu]AFH15286.1 hypothetical protein KO11_01475 [Escherichia coli KO11FL]MWE83652.1 hypothetical protein [Escherichia coli]UVY27850.1 MAG: hypothetical protein [Bacteriophage sp.]
MSSMIFDSCSFSRRLVLIAGASFKISAEELKMALPSSAVMIAFFTRRRTSADAIA